MLELREWANFHNLVLGIPTLGTPRFSVEHQDGSPLSGKELVEIRKTANEKEYLERRGVDGTYGAGSGDGIIHSAIAKSLRK